MRRRLGLLIALTLSALLTLAVAIPVAAHHRFPAEIAVPKGWQPEGITSGRGTTFYVGSLANGAIWEGDFRTGDGEVLIPSATGPAVGIDFERRHDRLWVAGGSSHEVRVYDVTSASDDPLATYTFPASGFLNDVVVTDDAAYVTDSNVQQLIVIPLGPDGSLPAAGDAFTLPLTGDIAYTTGFNVNGITESKGWLIIVQSNKGLLFRVDPQAGEAESIDTGGYSVGSGDGIEVRGNRLYVVRNFLNLVAVLKLSAHLESARFLGEITDTGLDVPTTATFSAGRLWAVNARFTTAPTPDTEYWITQLPTQP